MMTNKKPNIFSIHITDWFKALDPEQSKYVDTNQKRLLMEMLMCLKKYHERIVKETGDAPSLYELTLLPKEGHLRNIRSQVQRREVGIASYVRVENLLKDIVGIPHSSNLIHSTVFLEQQSSNGSATTPHCHSILVVHPSLNAKLRTALEFNIRTAQERQRQGKAVRNPFTLKSKHLAEQSFLAELNMDLITDWDALWEWSKYQTKCCQEWRANADAGANQRARQGYYTGAKARMSVSAGQGEHYFSFQTPMTPDRIQDFTHTFDKSSKEQRDDATQRMASNIA
jgi:hypothetical protein